MHDSQYVWIIDDDDSIRWVLQKALEAEQIEVNPMPSSPMYACRVWTALNCSANCLHTGHIYQSLS